MKTISSKILIFFLIIAVLAGNFIFPKKAEAGGLPTIDIANLSQSIYQFIKENIDKLIEDLKKGTLDRVRKGIIDGITRETIEWIQGDGKPKFVTDWKGFLRDAGNIAFDQVIRDVGAARLCEPFRLQVLVHFELPAFQGGFREEIACTLDEVVVNIEDFYRDFTKGGWIAYSKAWEPQNNYFGQMFMINDEIMMRQAAAVEAARNEAFAGKGFLSVKRCKGGGMLQDVAEVSGIEGLVRDDKGNYCEPGQMEIITPGLITGETLVSSLRLEGDWANSVQSITSVLVNSLINRIIGRGIALMDPPDTDDDQTLEERTIIERDKRINDIQDAVNDLKGVYKLKPETILYIKKIKDVLISLSDEVVRKVCRGREFDNILTYFQVQVIKNQEISRERVLDKIIDRIENIPTDVNKIETQINEIKNIIEKGDVLITEMEGATSISSELAQRFVQFMTEYSNYIAREENVLLRSAEQELNDKIREYWDIYKLVDDCD